MYMNSGILETYTAGSPSSPVQIRIYDKGKEIQKSSKHWFLPIWGLESGDDVWRVEFQLRRSFLHQYRITTLDTLWLNIGAIWQYLTAEWFSIRIPDNTKTERRTTHPWWLAVQECRNRFGDMSDAQRTFTSDTSEPIEKTLSHVIGRMVTIAVHKGISDKDEAIEYLNNLLKDKTEPVKFSQEYKKKTIRLGYRRTDLTDAEILADLPPWADFPGPGPFIPEEAEAFQTERTNKPLPPEPDTHPAAAEQSSSSSSQLHNTD
jgi:hypothetical protein